MPMTLNQQHYRKNAHVKPKNDANQWAQIWFKQLCRFHRVPVDRSWDFSAEQVIQFLRHRVTKKDPAWKRLKIVEALMHHQTFSGLKEAADLRFIRRKLRELAGRERAADDAAGQRLTYGIVTVTTDSADQNGQDESESQARSAADMVGKIDPREPVPIQDLRRKLRLAGKAFNTEIAYVGWVKRFLRSRGVTTMDQCQKVARKDVEAFLTDLVVDGNVASSTQDQAFYALQFFFESVLQRQIGNVDALRSSKPKLRPTVMSKSEVRKVLAEIDGNYLIIAKLLYGCGLRVSEALRLRVKDIDFDQHQIVVFCSKGKKSRIVPLPQNLVQPLKELLQRRRRLHEWDLDQGIASVWLPDALERKLPNARRELRWQFLVASHRFSKDPKTGRKHRHHLHRDSFTAALRKAVNRSGILKYVTSHTFRHSFATHLLQAGTDIRTLQELLGHQDVSTTMIYTHVLFDENQPVKSPLDSLEG